MGARIRIVLTLLGVWSVLFIVVIARSCSFVLPETFMDCDAMGRFSFSLLGTSKV